MKWQLPMMIVYEALCCHYVYTDNAVYCRTWQTLSVPYTRSLYSALQRLWAKQLIMAALC